MTRAAALLPWEEPQSWEAERRTHPQRAAARELLLPSGEAAALGCRWSRRCCSPRARAAACAAHPAGTAAAAPEERTAGPLGAAGPEERLGIGGLQEGSLPVEPRYPGEVGIPPEAEHSRLAAAEQEETPPAAKERHPREAGTLPEVGRTHPAAAEQEENLPVAERHPGEAGTRPDAGHVHPAAADQEETPAAKEAGVQAGDCDGHRAGAEHPALRQGEAGNRRV
mmetsp:Transcript_41614/g.98638  ORF Transcript_41614/g.98638 Transcript_41614/m.98638 type:complete len:225 (+) Transcript_41614:2869-3543(+)